MVWKASKEWGVFSEIYLLCFKDAWRSAIFLKGNGGPPSLLQNCIFFFLMRGCIGKDPNLRLALNKRVVFWKGGRNGQFRVKEAYNLLANPNDTAFPTSCIWVDRVLTKVAFFAWEATWGKVLTLDRLQKKG